MNLLDILKIKKIPNLTWSSSNPLNFKPNLKTLIYLFLGLSLFAIGETLLITANQGVALGPFLPKVFLFKLIYQLVSLRSLSA